MWWWQCKKYAQVTKALPQHVWLYFFSFQFARTVAGVCGRHGPPAQWRVGKGRSPGSDIVMLLCLNWGAKIARGMEGRLRSAVPSRVPVSILLTLEAARPFTAASLASIQTSSCIMVAPEVTFPMCFGADLFSITQETLTQISSACFLFVTLGSTFHTDTYQILTENVKITTNLRF